MGLYLKLQQGATPGPSDIATHRESLGGRVMAEAARRNWTAERNMTEILDAFYDALVHFRWRWTPRRSCGDLAAAAKTLDGEIVHAECFVPANAFHQLLIAPDPYGFGVARENARVTSYSGEENIIGGDPAGGPTLTEGFRRAINRDLYFFSAHPLAGVHGLGPNVFDIQTDRVVPMYAWADHKVVSFQNRFYDPCYNKVYVLKEDMTVALVIGVNEDRRPTRTIQEALSRVSEVKVFIKNWFQVAYFLTVPIGEMRGSSSEIKVEGPYARSICGDEDTYGDLTAIIKWQGAVD